MNEAEVDESTTLQNIKKPASRPERRSYPTHSHGWLRSEREDMFGRPDTESSRHGPNMSSHRWCAFYCRRYRTWFSHVIWFVMFAHVVLSLAAWRAAINARFHQPRVLEALGLLGLLGLVKHAGEVTRRTQPSYVDNTTLSPNQSPPQSTWPLCRPRREGRRQPSDKTQTSPPVSLPSNGPTARPNPPYPRTPRLCS
jgi:hypothetical protein